MIDKIDKLGWELASVGTYILRDGSTHPICLEKSGFDNSVRMNGIKVDLDAVSNIKDEDDFWDEDSDFWHSLSPYDRTIVKTIKANILGE